MKVDSRPRPGFSHAAMAAILSVLFCGELSSQGAAGQPAREGGKRRVAAESILFLHAGAFDARDVKRSREEALDLARRTLADLRAGKVSFEDASHRISEEPNAARNGGYLGAFRRGELSDDMKAVEEALFGLEVGEISGVIESPLGVHILRRVPIREWAGAHILLQWSGCRNAPAGLKRSREEALRLAGDVLAAAARPGAEFADLARRHSEAPDRVEGGALGVFGPNEILKPLERAIDRLAPGEVGGPVETGLGFHIVRRESIPRARAAHILLRFRGVSCSEGVTRSREEALALAQEILARIRKGADFAALARKHSEDGNAARGGDLGVFLAGEMEKPFAAAVFALEVGEVSSIVETRHGLHLIQRLPEN